MPDVVFDGLAFDDPLTCILTGKTLMLHRLKEYYTFDYFLPDEKIRFCSGVDCSVLVFQVRGACKTISTSGRGARGSRIKMSKR